MGNFCCKDEHIPPKEEMKERYKHEVRESFDEANIK
jgi:hypothetical protein